MRHDSSLTYSFLCALFQKVSKQNHIISFWFRRCNLSENVTELVEKILGELKKRKLNTEEWEIIANLVRAIPRFPYLPGPLFLPIMQKNVPFGTELVIIRNGKVLLMKRNFFGDEAYHTPGTYVAPGETFLKAAQRCADQELKIGVKSINPISPPINHLQNRRFQDVTSLFFCETESEPIVGEWFGLDNFPHILEVQQEYPQYIKPLLR